MVFISSTDFVFRRYMFDLKSSYLSKYGDQVNASQLVMLTVKNSDDLLNQISNLEKKGKIRDVHLAVYSPDGHYSFNSFGLSEALTQSGSKIKMDLQRWGEKVASWPENLFSAKSRFAIYNFKITGEPGQQKVTQFGQLMLKRGDYLLLNQGNDPWAQTQENFRQKRYWEQSEIQLADQISVASIGVPIYCILLLAATFEDILKYDD